MNHSYSIPTRRQNTRSHPALQPGRLLKSIFTDTPPGGRQQAILLACFVLLKFGLQYWLISPEYELHRDEYLHLDQAKHLAWGYLSVPPVTSWTSYLILLLGNQVFWVKFFPALFGALTLVVVWKTVEALQGNLFALLLSAVALTFSAILLRINMLYQPNSPDIFCWTLLYFCFIRYLQSDNPNWLWMAAVTFAFGFLNKYNIVFLALGFLPALLLTDRRRVLRNRHFYLALALALVLVSPNLMWQYQNGFPVFHHLDELTRTQLKHVKRVDFLKEQLLYFAGSALIIIAAFVAFFTYAPFRKYQVFFWAFVCTLTLFLYLQAKAYYAVGLYPVLIAFGSVYLGQVLRQGWRMYLAPVVLVIPVLVLLPFIQVAFPLLSPAEIRRQAPRFQALGLLRWEDGQDHALPQDFADMLGWRELAAKVDQAYSRLPDKAHTLVLCDNYGQAGAINYYSRHPNMQAVSMSADYINWFPLEKMKVKNVILIQEADDTDKNRNRERPMFHAVSLAGEIQNPYARESGTRIYLLEGAKVTINDILQGEIAGIKAGR